VIISDAVFVILIDPAAADLAAAAAAGCGAYTGLAVG
jgi:hypothetical protein